MSEPRNAATTTRQLVNHAVAFHECFGHGFPGDTTTFDAALAAARAEALAEVRARVEGLAVKRVESQGFDPARGFVRVYGGDQLDRAAVLALLDPPK